MNALQSLKLLGLKVRDKITKLEGIVTSVSFDLYGCVQAIVDQGLDKDGKHQERFWFDEKRLEVIDTIPVMTPPDWGALTVESRVAGPAEKPSMNSNPLPR